LIARIFLFSETLSLIFAHARKKVCLSFMKNTPFSVPSIIQGLSGIEKVHRNSIKITVDLCVFITEKQTSKIPF